MLSSLNWTFYSSTNFSFILYTHNSLLLHIRCVGWLADWLAYYSWMSEWLCYLVLPDQDLSAQHRSFNSIIKITSFSKIPLFKHVYLSKEGHHLMDRFAQRHLLLLSVFTAVKPIRKLTFYVENHHLLFIYLFTSSHSRWLTCKVFFSSCQLPLTDIWNLVDLLSWFAFGLVLFQARGWCLLR